MNPVEAKLLETQHHFEQMLTNQELGAAFQHNVNAFLVSARSIVGVLERSRKRNPIIGDWWKLKSAELKTDPSIKFFKGLRDTTVHEKPIVPSRDVSATITGDVITFVEGIHVKLIRDGKVVQSHEAITTKNPAASQPEVNIRSTWHFAERPIENAIELCQGYLDRLRTLAEQYKQLAENTNDA